MAIRCLLLYMCVALVPLLRAADADANADGAFDQSIRPLLKTYCLTCHSTEKHKGDFDLQRFSSLTEFKKNSKVLQSIAEQFANNDMPPAKEPQPTVTEKSVLSKWVNSTLDAIALSHAGDPGPVVLRRLSNAEYTYTIRDLTGVESLDPAREFPVDGAAGEGFTNTGQGLVMSPSLITKYLDAGKDIATHAVLLSDGIRFSAKTTRRDRTEEILAEIRSFYRDFTDPGAGEKFNLQGVVFETNTGGRLPLDKYLAATLAERDALNAGTKSFQAVALERHLNAKYLETLFRALTDNRPSLILDDIRARWRSAKPQDAGALAANIDAWQKALWRFGSVGHIGKLNGPKAWMEPASPLATKWDVKLKLPASTDGKDVTLYLASNAGADNANNVVLWQEPRLVAPGRPPLLLRDVREACRTRAERRERLFSNASKALSAAAAAQSEKQPADVAQLAVRHNIDPDVLTAWFDFLGVNGAQKTVIENHFAAPIKAASTFDFITGWGKAETPSILANSSDKAVRIPGNMKPHSIAVHPSPTLKACVGWQSPIAANITIEASVTRSHPECGNGILWFLEVRHGSTRRDLAHGAITDNATIKSGPFPNISVQSGDLISILIDPREGNHSCDLTGVNLTITTTGDAPKVWNLAADVAPNILAGNPHADSFGNPAVWHFYTEAIKDVRPSLTIPAGSILAHWQSSANNDEKSKLAADFQALLTSNAAPANTPDAALLQQLNAFAATALKDVPQASPIAAPKNTYGLDPALFGHHPNGEARDASSLCVQAPSFIEIRLPADLAAGCEFVTTGTLDKKTSVEGSVQLQVLFEKPASLSSLVTSGPAVSPTNGTWTATNSTTTVAAPFIANDGSNARKKLDAAFDDVRQLFPASLCYTKIVPTDEVVTLTLFYREDDQLARLMLDANQKAQLDKLWNDLHYVSLDALTLIDAFEQLWQFATQDGDPKIFEPMREPIKQRAAAFRQLLTDTQPKHLDAVLEFAQRAYRRPLSNSEKTELRELYQKLRSQDLQHEDAVRLTLARVLVAPAFLYRAEKPVQGATPGAITDWELANRLSYFLWSSMPDAELRAVASNGTLHTPEVLAQQTQRMLRDPRVRRMAIEFGCSWLHVHGFDELSEKSDRHFPTFVSLRGAMYEETIQFFTDFFQHDQPVLNILDSDYTFLNDALAKHYGIPNVNGPEWRRVDGVKKFARGGILAQASTLAKQSGASRTSPILRGNWVAEALLGDKLPKPPKDVPPLPDDVSNEKLTVRQLVEKHTTDARCANCHKRIDAFGFSLEGFDAIGRRREKDLGDRPIDAHAKTQDGAEFNDIDGLRQYLLTQRRDAFMRQFCRKLLGYSLGRSIQLSDEPLLKELQTRLAQKDYRIGVAIDTIVQSSQFRNIRGRDAVNDD